MERARKKNAEKSKHQILSMWLYKDALYERADQWLFHLPPGCASTLDTQRPPSGATTPYTHPTPFSCTPPLQLPSCSPPRTQIEHPPDKFLGPRKRTREQTRHKKNCLARAMHKIKFSSPNQLRSAVLIKTTPVDLLFLVLSARRASTAAPRPAVVGFPRLSTSTPVTLERNFRAPRPRRARC